MFDIGSLKLRAILAKKGLNNTFNIRGYKEYEYDGFYQGDFIMPEKLSLLFGQVIQDLDATASRDLNKVYQAAQKGNKNAMLVSKEKACTLCSHYGHISEYCPLVGEKRTI